MEDSQLPAAAPFFVDTRGAEIINGNGVGDPEVYLPMHEEMISHIALDVCPLSPLLLLYEADDQARTVF